MSFPWMGYYFFRLALCMQANWDIAIVCTVAAGLNFLQSRQRPYWHAYQVAFLPYDYRGQLFGSHPQQLSCARSALEPPFFFMPSSLPHYYFFFLLFFFHL
jgi:hypothetical protein